MSNKPLASAVHAIIGTPGLLEAILLYLVIPPVQATASYNTEHMAKVESARATRQCRLRQLLLSQSVIKAFQATIDGSPKLQEFLSFCQVALRQDTSIYWNVNDHIRRETGLGDDGIVVDGRGTRLYMPNFYVTYTIYLYVRQRGFAQPRGASPVPLKAGSWQRMTVLQGHRPNQLKIFIAGPEYKELSSDVRADERIVHLLKRVCPGRWV